MAKLLTITNPDTHSVYYRMNRKDLYTKTIPREGLQGAFVSWRDFEDYVSQITQSLYSGNYIDEFKYTKQLIDGAYSNGKIVTEVIENYDGSATSLKNVVKTARKLFSKMKFPSSNYNAYSRFNESGKTITTWTNSERIVFITTSDLLADIDVEVLAESFNMNKTDFLGRIVEVDEFENEEILGVICDESFIQIYDNIFRFDEFYNARVMAWNEYLHAWGTYAISPFANAVAIVTSNPVPPTPTIKTLESIAVKNNGNDSIQLAESDVNVTKTLTFVPTPSDADYEVISVLALGGLQNKVTLSNITKTGCELVIGSSAITENGSLLVQCMSGENFVQSDAFMVYAYQEEHTQLTSASALVGGENEVTLSENQLSVTGTLVPNPDNAEYTITSFTFTGGLETIGSGTFDEGSLTAFTITLSEAPLTSGTFNVVLESQDGTSVTSSSVTINPYQA